MHTSEKYFMLKALLRRSSDKLRTVTRYVEQDKQEQPMVRMPAMLIELDYIRCDYDSATQYDVYSGSVDLILMMEQLTFGQHFESPFYNVQLVDDVVNWIRGYNFTHAADGFVLIFDHVYRQKDEYGFTSYSQGRKARLRGTDIFHIKCNIVWREEPIVYPKAAQRGVGQWFVGCNFKVQQNDAEGGTYAGATADVADDFDVTPYISNLHGLGH